MSSAATNGRAGGTERGDGGAETVLTVAGRSVAGPPDPCDPFEPAAGPLLPVRGDCDPRRAVGACGGPSPGSGGGGGKRNTTVSSRALKLLAILGGRGTEEGARSSRRPVCGGAVGALELEAGARDDGTFGKEAGTRDDEGARDEGGAPVRRVLGRVACIA